MHQLCWYIGIILFLSFTVNHMCYTLKINETKC